MEPWLLESVDDPNVRDAVAGLMSEYPNSRSAVMGLVKYFDLKLQQFHKDSPGDELQHKKRKIEVEGKPIATMDNISFAQPKRKKYKVQFLDVGLQLISNTNEQEYTYHFADIKVVTCVPTPERNSFTFCLFVRPESQSATSVAVFTMDDRCKIAMLDPSNGATQQSTMTNHEVLCVLLKKYADLDVCRPDPALFCATGAPMTTGKKEERLYVPAHLNAKDGMLFFLPSGILFGFKTPTFFVPVKHLAGVVITNVVSRTFDLTLNLQPGCQALGLEANADKDGKVAFLFSTIYLEEYDGIESYRKKLGIDDKSMTENTKAQEPKANKAKGADQTIDDIAEEDEENDHDFKPQDSDADSLDYDSDAGSDDQRGAGSLEAEDDNDMEEAGGHGSESSEEGEGEGEGEEEEEEEEEEDDLEGEDHEEDLEDLGDEDEEVEEEVDLLDSDSESE